MDKDEEDDDKKNKLLKEIKKAAGQPTESEWSSLITLVNDLPWEKFRLVVMDFVVKIHDKKIQHPYHYLLTVMREKVKENEDAI